MLKKIAIMLTAIVLSITMLSSFSVSAESTKLSRAKITEITSDSCGEMTLKLKKVKKCSGYVVKISQNKNFSKSKSYKIKANEKIFRNLKQGRKYYVKAKVYNNIKIDGKPKTVYGKWNKAKSVIVKENEKDKERKEQVKQLTGIKLSSDVHFLKYTRDKWVYEEYDNAVSYDIKAKIKIKKKELKRIIKDNKFIKKPKSYMGTNAQYSCDCDWWDLKKSMIKDYYHLFCSKKITEYVSIKTVSREIMVTKNEDKNGFVIVYLALDF